MNTPTHTLPDEYYEDDTYQPPLVSGVECHRFFPKTFWIPPESARKSLRPGDHAKLFFAVRFAGGDFTEGLWVTVTEVKFECYIGVIESDPSVPCVVDEVEHGQEVQFHADHIIDICWKGDRTVAEDEEIPGEPRVSYSHHSKRKARYKPRQDMLP